MRDAHLQSPMELLEENLLVFCNRGTSGIDGSTKFEVIMDVVVKKNDKFHLFYKDLNAKDYSSAIKSQ